MDAFARGLIIAEKIVRDGQLMKLRDARYRSFVSGAGARFAAGDMKLQDLRDHAAAGGEPALESGKQELVENLINDYMFA